MKRALFIRFLILSLFSFVAFRPLTPAHAQTAWEPGRCVGTGDFEGVATIQGFECLLANILNVAISLIGVAIIFMLLMGGFKLLTSGGDPKGVAAGKQTITYAIIGLVLAISAWFILNLIAQFTGADILIFRLSLDN